jgi:hypothetical protein
VTSDQYPVTTDHWLLITGYWILAACVVLRDMNNLRQTVLGVVLLSAGVLAFEITLTRIFAVAQWYHFAFMAVSVALLGFGASGTALAIWPAPARYPQRWMSPLSAAFAATVLASFLVVNYVPFDSYRIAWEPIQFVYLAVYYLALTTPFFFAGAVVGALLSSEGAPVNQIYAANLAGSGLGALVALAGLTWLSPPGVVLLAAALGLAAAIAFNPASSSRHYALRTTHYISFVLIAAIIILATDPPPFLDIRLSPYKTLSTLLRYPDTQITFTGWNAFSRVDAIESSTIRSYPGLSFGYVGPTPAQVGITVDGDNLTPITANANEEALAFLDALPTALPYRLVDSPRTLIIEPGGGLDVLQALRQGASHVTAVERNPLIVDVVRRLYSAYSGQLYTRPDVTVEIESGRGFARRAVAAGRSFARAQDGPFDLVHISLADSFKVVNFGAYSLTESPTYTVDAFRDFYRLLSDDGILVIPRWLQLPPSESLRAAATVITALEAEGVDRPTSHLVAYRTFRTMTLLVKRRPFTPDQLAAIRQFVAENSFDLVAAPDITPADVNQHNVLEEPAYYQAFQQLLGPDRARFVAGYGYDISPPTDDRPFFYHYFRWSQVNEILATFGKTWQPFGGGGYLVLFILLALATLASVGLIVLPLLIRRLVQTDHGSRSERPRRVVLSTFVVFSALGIGFLFIEIPLIQHFVVFLGHPTLAFAAVVLAILLFSGLGSLAAPRVPVVAGFAVAALGAILYPAVLRPILAAALGASLIVRLGVAVLSLAPLGFFMGVPFPRALALVEAIDAQLAPWAWAINGCASVLGSILATMLAMSAGFSAVLAVAGGAYLAGLLAIMPLTRCSPNTS